MKPARLLVADGREPITAARLAEEAGFKSAASIYPRVDAGERIAGEIWQWARDESGRQLYADEPAAAEPAPYNWQSMPAMVPTTRKPAPAPANGHAYATAAEVIENVLPLNPRGPGHLTAPWGIPPYYAPTDH